MALHNLKITVVDGGKANSQGWGSDLYTTPVTSKENAAKNSKMYKMLNYNQTIRESVKKATSPATFFALQTGVGLASQTARQAINYYISDIGRKNGDSNYQDAVNRKIEQATDVLSIFGGALSGAAAGSVIPGIGTAIGTVAGAASAAINLKFKYAERGRAYAHEMFQDNNSQVYNLSRANYSIYTGRVR